MRVWQYLALVNAVSAVSYAPLKVECPKDLRLRAAKNGDINALETEYLEKHRSGLTSKFSKFYEDLAIPGIDLTSNITFPTVAVAISGGGFRSMLTSSGFILGMHQYGLWECTSYVSAISGGSWTLLKLIEAGFNLESLSKFDMERLMLEGIPNFDLKNHDLLRQADFGNDGASNAKLFESDEQFMKELRKKFGNNRKRDAPTASEVAFEYLLDSISELAQDQKFSEAEIRSALHKRSMDSLYKIKGIIDDFFHEDEKRQDNELEILNELLESFGKFRKTIGFYINLHRQVRQKKEAGFQISFTDYLGQALLDRIPIDKQNSLNHFSDILHADNFKTYQSPIPLIISNAKNVKGPQLRNVVFEFSPFEFGSWHLNVSRFIPIKYLGSTVEGGNFINCVTGFDNLGFITATSSSLFNNALLYIWRTVTMNIQSDQKLNAIKTVFDVFGAGFNKLRSDYAIYQPNPFYKHEDIIKTISNSSQLLLVDGGEDGENIPVRSMLVSGRHIDVVFIVDSSSDKDNFPDMTKLQDTYENVVLEKDSLRVIKSGGKFLEVAAMPYIPTRKELFAANFNLSSPIAFGCHLQSFSPKQIEVADEEQTKICDIPPILIYHANAPVTYPSNTSTFKLNYTRAEFNGMLNNGHHLFDNDDRQGEYLQCLGCVMLLRNNPVLQSPFCDTCIRKLCYN